MSYTTAGRNAAADAVEVTQMSVHTGAPGNNGANNEHPDADGYARQNISYDAAINGVRTQASDITFNVSLGQYSHYALWAGSTCVDTGTFNSVKDMTEAGELVVSGSTHSVGP